MARWDRTGLACEELQHPECKGHLCVLYLGILQFATCLNDPKIQGSQNDDQSCRELYKAPNTGLLLWDLNPTYELRGLNLHGLSREAYTRILMGLASWCSNVLAFLSDLLFEFPTDESLRTGDGEEAKKKKSNELIKGKVFCFSH